MRAAATPKKVACGNFLATDRRRLQSIRRNKRNCFANGKRELLMVHQTKRQVFTCLFILCLLKLALRVKYRFYQILFYFRVILLRLP